MTKHSTPRGEGDGLAAEDDDALRAREEAVSNRETWVRARETITGEHEILVLDRESAVELREEALHARATVDDARLERERLLVQMREANERLVLAVMQADELADQAHAARVVAAESAAAESEARRRAEAAAAQLRLREEALRASERMLRDSDRAKDHFLAILGHELRNPLAPIVMALDLIAMDSPDPHEREHAIIARQVRHLVQLVDELLDTSRIRTGKIALQRRPVELADAVSRAVEMAGPLIASYGHALTVDVPSPGLTVDGDVVRLAQVVANLLTNAAKFTPSGGAITVIGEARGMSVVVRVRDTGIGIAAEMLPRIFDAYAQETPQETERVPAGLGLGLAIVRSIVAMHGGTVIAHSDGLGTGTEMVVELPGVLSRADQPSGAAATDVRAEDAHRILVVDDHRDAASVMVEAMRRLGHDVRVAHDGAAALGIAADFGPDVVLLDLGLPGLEGYEVARRVRAASSHRVQIIAVTGYGQAIDRQRSADAGLDAHLVKPVDVATLQRTVDEAWRSWH